MHSPPKSSLRHSQEGSQGHRMLFSKATFRWKHVLSLCSHGVTSEGCRELAAGCGQGWEEAPGPRAPPPSCNAKAACRAGVPCSRERDLEERFHWKRQGKTNLLGKRRGGGQARAPWCVQAAAFPRAMGWTLTCLQSPLEGQQLRAGFVPIRDKPGIPALPGEGVWRLLEPRLYHFSHGGFRPLFVPVRAPAGGMLSHLALIAERRLVQYVLLHWGITAFQKPLSPITKESLHLENMSSDPLM